MTPREVVHLIVNTMLAINKRAFEVLKQNEVLTERIEEDYNVFCETVQNILNETGSFNMKELQKRIPYNTWAPIFIYYCEKRKGNRPNVTEQEIFELFDKLGSPFDIVQ
jgi:hypothetical protein